jgi:hypothetical protein
MSLLRRYSEKTAPVCITILTPPPCGFAAARRNQRYRSTALSATRLGFIALEERDTSLGRVRVKVIRDDTTLVRVAPEFEECRRIAETRGIPLQDVYRIIERETWEP